MEISRTQEENNDKGSPGAKRYLLLKFNHHTKQLFIIFSATQTWAFGSLPADSVTGSTSHEQQASKNFKWCRSFRVKTEKWTKRGQRNPEKKDLWTPSTGLKAEEQNAAILPEYVTFYCRKVKIRILFNFILKSPDHRG